MNTGSEGDYLQARQNRYRGSRGGGGGGFVLGQPSKAVSRQLPHVALYRFGQKKIVEKLVMVA